MKITADTYKVGEGIHAGLTDLDVGARVFTLDLGMRHPWRERYALSDVAGLSLGNGGCDFMLLEVVVLPEFVPSRQRFS